MPIKLMGQTMKKEIKEKRCLQEPSAHLNQLLDISDDLLMMKPVSWKGFS